MHCLEAEVMYFFEFEPNVAPNYTQNWFETYWKVGLRPEQHTEYSPTNDIHKLLPC